MNEGHEEINSVGGEDEKYFLTKRQHDDYLKGLKVNTDDYQLGYQSGMVALQRELSLRNRDIIISKPQEEKDKIEASTSTPEGSREQIQANPSTRKWKGIVVNSPKKIKQKSPDKQVVNKEQQQNESPPEEPPNKVIESKKEVVPLEAAIRPFSFELEVAKMMVSLPFNEICRNSEYREKLSKMIKTNNLSNDSDYVNVEDDNPTILFGPRVES